MHIRTHTFGVRATFVLITKRFHTHKQNTKGEKGYEKIHNETHHDDEQLGAGWLARERAAKGRRGPCQGSGFL